MAMQPVEDPYPIPQDSGHVAAATEKLANRFLKEWESVTHQIKNTARAGDNYENQVKGLPTVADQIVAALGGARPDPEKRQLAGAVGNGVGVGWELGRALGKADDPNTDPGTIDFDAANRSAGLVSGAIGNAAAGLAQHPEPPEDGGPPQI